MPDAAARPVADIGSGTGIFTRQLAGILPPAVEIIGVEPSRPMRDQALRSSPGDRIRYIDGAAEKLPFAGGTIGAVTAATAAHWFDFPAFLSEAKRKKLDEAVKLLQFIRLIPFLKDSGLF